MNRNRMIAALASAAVCLTGIAPMTADADMIVTQEGAEQFFQHYPVVYQNAECTWYSNWDTVEGNGYRSVYYTQGSPSAGLSCTVSRSEITEDRLNEIIGKFFDDSYHVSVSETLTALTYSQRTEPTWSIVIHDSENRAETEEKAKAFYDALSGSCTALGGRFQKNLQLYYHIYDLTCFCSYDFSLGTTDGTDGGEKVLALVSAQFPEWEVTLSGSEKEWYTIRKTGYDLYEVPLEEYLTVEDAIREQLGYAPFRVWYPEELEILPQVTYYPDPAEETFGDADQDGEVNIKDAQAVLTAAGDLRLGLDTGLTELQLRAADVDGDGQVTVKDAQYILVYYANTRAEIECSWQSVTGNPNAPAESNLI